MLNYEQFINAVAQKVTEEMGVNHSIVIHESLKTNGVTRKGLTIGEKNSNISPTIYLEEYYENYESGWELTEIVESFIRLYEKAKFEKNFEVEKIQNFENVKNKLSYKLINYEMNQQLLQNVPYEQYLDFAIVFYVLLETTEHGSATVLVTNDMVNYWGTTKEELYQLAEESSQIILPPEFLPMRVVINQLIKKRTTQEDLEENCMYVLSNQYRHFGASAILYKGVLENIGNELQMDYYILPSSIHEVIILPVDCEMTEEELNEMVEEINQTHLGEEEVLSNHVYFYDRITKELR